MQLSLFSDYSLRVLMFAALKEDTFQIEEVTAAYGISRHHVAKVVHSLSKLQYLETRRGRGGGIALAQPAGEIRLGGLLRETEKHSAFVECFDAATNTCMLDGSCKLKGLLAHALNSFYLALDQHTLTDLINGSHRKLMVQALFGTAL